MRVTSWFVAAFPILLGSLVVYNKHYLLRIPKIGFILHAIAGGPVPPYMSLDIFDRQDEWLNANDVLISVPLKSGTHWMMYTLNIMRSKGNPRPFRDIYEEVPWAEFVHYRGQPLDERIAHIRNISSGQPFKLIKTHASPETFKVRDDVKYVVVFRNVHDVVASVRSFFSNHRRDFANHWGGFPPSAEQNQTDEEYKHFITEDCGDGQPFIKPFVINTLKFWWPYRNQSNVLILHYSELINDSVTQIEKLNKFLGLNLSPVQVSDIADKVCFAEMKKVSQVLESRHLLDFGKSRGQMPKDVELLLHDSDSILNKGPDRDGDWELPPDLSDAVTQTVNEAFSGKLAAWLQHGGFLPVEVDG